MTLEPMEINGGRFYVRPLHDDDRIDDRPRLARIVGEQQAEKFVQQARDDWRSGDILRWASCEQTCIDMAALVVLTKTSETTCRVEGLPAGDPEDVLPNPDDLEQKTFGDAAREGAATVSRWAEGYLGLTVENDHN